MLLSTIPTHALATVDKDRLRRGVESLTEGHFSITLARVTDREISAVVMNGEQKPYAVTLTDQRCFCACPDAMFRGVTCKHAVALSLFVIRASHVTISAGESEADELPAPDLTLAKVRRNSI